MPPEKRFNLDRFVDSVRRVLRRFFRRKEDERIMSRVQALRSTSVFGELPTRYLIAMAEVMHERRYRRDEYVYFEGDPGLGMYLIARGRVRLTRRDDQDQDSDIGELAEKDVFGVLSVFEDLRRDETVQSLADTVILGLFRPDLNVVSHRNPAAGVGIYRALARYISVRYASLLQRVEERNGRSAMMSLLAEPAEELSLPG